MLYWVYSVLGTIIFFLLLPFVSLYILARPQSKFCLVERLGNIPVGKRKKKSNSPTIWVHASSVGEVQAARALITELTGRNLDVKFIVSTMTLPGLNVARKQLPADVFCFLAPIDVPFIVRRVLNLMKPAVYICLETELWPAMLVELRKRGTSMALLNGRLTEHSFKRYSYVRSLMKKVLYGFTQVGVIRPEDKERLQLLGVPEGRIQVTGNLKYDFSPEDTVAVRRQYRKRLGVDKEKVFICGSTRTGEEQILVDVFLQLQGISGSDFILVLAPRHLERLEEIQDMLSRHKISYDLYTAMRNNRRESRVVLVDCMGELSRLYSAGDFIFCGGSLVDKGGHNIMEAARWGRPVYYGPNMNDFRDAVEILENGEAGFQVETGSALIEYIKLHLQNKTSYQKACDNAVRVTALQRGAAVRQADIVQSMLVH